MGTELEEAARKFREWRDSAEPEGDGPRWIWYQGKLWFRDHRGVFEQADDWDELNRRLLDDK